MFSPKGDGHKDGHKTERKSKYQIARDIPVIVYTYRRGQICRPLMLGPLIILHIDGHP